MKVSLQHRAVAWTAIALSAGVLAGCASAPGQGQHPQDPWETYNRQMDQFNQQVDEAVLKPVATAYRDITPTPVRTGVSNFFGNLGDAWSFVNHTLQAQPESALSSLFRFSINTTFGLVGVLDIATEMGLERHKTDFGLTLDRWGMPTGPYLVLPLLGPSTLRDTAAIPVDGWGDLAGQVSPVSSRNSLYGLRLLDTRTRLLRMGNLLDGAALDKYSFTRDAYLQMRRNDALESAGGYSEEEGAPGDARGDSLGGYIPPEPDEAAPTGVLK